MQPDKNLTKPKNSCRQRLTRADASAIVYIS
jgi:hypothetical protein